MEQSILSGAFKEGLFALLFVFLLLYQLKENKANMEKAEEREEKLLSFLDEMKEQFSRLTKQYERLSDDVERIRKKIE